MIRLRRLGSIVGAVAGVGAIVLLAFACAQQPWGEPCSTEACRVAEEPLFRVEPRPEPVWLEKRQENVFASGVLEGRPRLCARYAEVAGRVVNGWYLTEFDKIGYGGMIGTFRGASEVPDRTIGWDCRSDGLHLALDLPENDEQHEKADDALADILSALPWRGLDPKADEMRIVVTLVKTGDRAAFEAQP